MLHISAMCMNVHMHSTLSYWSQMGGLRVLLWSAMLYIIVLLG